MFVDSLGSVSGLSGVSVDTIEGLLTLRNVGGVCGVFVDSLMCFCGLYVVFVDSA